MRRFILLLTCLVCSAFLGAQQNRADSLHALIEQTEPSQRISLYFELAEFYAGKLPEKAMQYNKEALELARLLNQTDLINDACFHLGYHYYKVNNYDSAIFYLNLANTGYFTSNHSEGLAKTYNRLGNAYHLKGQNEKALEFFNKALSFSRELESKIELGRSLTNISSIYRIYGKYENAIEYDIRALKLYEEENYQDGIAWTSINIARLLSVLNNQNKAIEYAKKALLIYNELEKNADYKPGAILATSELGKIFHQKGDLKIALSYFEEVLELNIKADNQYGIANTMANIGKIYFEAGNYNESIKQLNQALSIKMSLSDSLEFPEIYNYLGNAYLQKNRYAKAEDYFNKGYQIAQKKNLKADLTNSFLNLSQLADKKGEYKKALWYYKKYTSQRDSLNVEEITQLQLQYEFDKKQKEYEFEQQQKDIIQREKLRRQKLLSFSFIVGFVLMIVLAVVIYISYKRKKETNIQLSLQNEEIRQQKEEIEAQRDEIEQQKDYAVAQRDKIASQQKVITDSIRYASRIQKAILPQHIDFTQILPEHFIYNLPRDLVSGDFYWFTKKGQKLILVAADCTGHGVPGAFMSMLGVTLLNEIVNRNHVYEPNEVLNRLRKSLIEALHQKNDETESSDGMDMTYCLIDLESLKMQFSGAYNPIYIIRKEEDGTWQLHEFKGDKMPVGVYLKEHFEPFSQREIQLKKNDTLYMFSDGYYDQFGSGTETKYKPKNFKQFLLSIQEEDLEKQKELIISNFENWKGNYRQLDDVLVMGFKF